MGGWLFLMLLMLVAGREAARELSVFQITELRSLIGFCMFYPLVRAHGGFRAMATMRLPQHLGRNAVHYGAQYLWFLALTLIPVAQVVSIESTMPIWTAILAALFLGERITVRKSLAIVLGVIGVVIIVRPGVGESNVGQLIMLIAAVGFGISIVLMKSLTRTDPVVVIIFWMLVIQSAIGFGPALYTWTWPSAHVWPWVVVVAFCGTFSHYCMTNAMRYADATIVVPMDFLRVPLSAAVGWLVYAERLDLYTIIGAAIILAGNMLNLTSGTPARAKAAA